MYDAPSGSVQAGAQLKMKHFNPSYNIGSTYFNNIESTIFVQINLIYLNPFCSGAKYDHPKSGGRVIPSPTVQMIAIMMRDVRRLAIPPRNER